MRKIIMAILCLSLALLTACQPTTATLSKETIEPKMEKLAATISSYVDELLIHRELRGDDYYELVCQSYPLVTHVSSTGYNTDSKAIFYNLHINGCSFKDGEIIPEPCADGLDEDKTWEQYLPRIDTVEASTMGVFLHYGMRDRFLLVDSITMDLDDTIAELDLPHHLIGLYVVTADGQSTPLTIDSIDYQIATTIAPFDPKYILNHDHYGKLISGFVPIVGVGELRYVIASKRP